jgi:hypothetical protein
VKYYFIGDVHAWMDDYKRIISTIPHSIQLGDMGLGFYDDIDAQFPDNPAHRFIRGNHDNPLGCQGKCSYLGDYGYEVGVGGTLFWLGGGFSIAGITVENDPKWLGEAKEQLTYATMQNALEVYTEVKPDIMVSHECPRVCLVQMGKEANGINSATAKLLDCMLEAHAPKVWAFGHHHRSIQFEEIGCQFHGLDSLEMREIEM